MCKNKLLGNHYGISYETKEIVTEITRKSYELLIKGYQLQINCF